MPYYLMLPAYYIKVNQTIHQVRTKWWIINDYNVKSIVESVNTLIVIVGVLKECLFNYLYLPYCFSDEVLKYSVELRHLYNLRIYVKHTVYYTNNDSMTRWFKMWQIFNHLWFVTYDVWTPLIFIKKLSNKNHCIWIDLDWSLNFFFAKINFECLS